MSSERDALLAAVCEHAADDTPRLVFADWLDEHDSPHWAALIRAECELARLADDGSASQVVFQFFDDYDKQTHRGVKWAEVDPAVGRRVELLKQILRVRTRAWKAIKAVFPPEKKCGLMWRHGTRRGFPAGAWVTDSNKLIAIAPQLTRVCPPIALRLNRVSGDAAETARQLVEAKLVRWCESLLLPLPELVMEFSKSPDAVGISKLMYYGAESALSSILQEVAKSPHWSGLRSLDIRCQGPMTALPTPELFQAKHLQKLTRLRIGRATWTPETLRELRHLTELSELHLTQCGLDDTAAEALANVPGLRKLRWLELDGNRIGGRGATALLASNQFSDLAFLDFQANPVRGIDREALANVPAGGLRGVDFHGCRLTLKDVTALTSSPRLSNLLYLDMDYNRLVETAVARLIKGLGNNAPAVLYLMGNRFDEVACQAFADWPGAARIHMLHLHANPLKTSAAQALAASPNFRKLRHLCVSGVPEPGQKALKDRFRTKVTTCPG